MSITKNMIITDSLGQEVDRRDIGAEAQNIDVSRDADGKIITDITASGVEISSVESLTQTLKNIENNSQITLTFDDIPIAGSDNPVKSKGLVLDTALSPTSTKSVQNKVITEALSTKLSTYASNSDAWDETPAANSTKPVTSRGIYSALNNKQNTLTFDNVPIENSDNPVTSGGVYNSLKDLNTIKYYLKDAPIVSRTNFNNIMNTAFDNWVDDNLNPATMTNGDLGQKLSKLYFDIYTTKNSSAPYNHCIFTNSNLWLSGGPEKSFVAFFESIHNVTTSEYIILTNFWIRLESDSLLNTKGNRFDNCRIGDDYNQFYVASPYQNSTYSSKEFNKSGSSDTLDITNMYISMYTM